MRIAFISRRYFPAVSGMSVYARNLLVQLAARGHDVTMVSQYRGDPAGAGVYGGGPPPPVPGVRVLGMEARGEQNGGDFEADVVAMAAMVEELHAEAPLDIIHAQYAYPTGLAALEASRRTGVPNLVSVQGGDGHWVGLCCRTHRDAMAAVLGHTGALLIGSRSFAEEVETNHGVALDRFTIVAGATDTGAFAPRPDRPLGAVATPPVVLYHGRIDRRKGVLELLDAVATVVAKGIALRLVVSGIGPDVTAVDQRVDELGLGGVVVRQPPTSYDEAPSVYRKGDVFVSPTWSEGFSNTILEAMASGLPVLSTRTVGVIDCLRHGDNGMLVDVHDVDALAVALANLLTDDALRRRLATTALDEVRARYSWPVAAASIEAIYERLRGTRPDDNWPPLAALGQPVDASCRFRAAPHLL